MLLILCAAILLPYNVLSFPNLVTEDSDKGRPYGEDILYHNLTPELKKMHIDSYIRNRYARTIIHTNYINPKNEPQEVEFSVVLPEQAFITEFIMVVKDKEYKGYVREKDAAKSEYADAVNSGLGAAHVAASLRDSNEFTVSINVQAFSKVSFNLTYEHLLEMKSDMYELVLHLHPDQIVEDFSVKVNINETKPIINIHVPEIVNEKEIFDSYSRNEYVTISDLNPEGTEKQIIFTPTTEQQQSNDEINGIQRFTGRFIVRYEIDQNSEDGEVITSDGHFVHFFSPKNIPPLPKNVIFVLDISGSMMGYKMYQLKQAMEVILGECNEDDYFSVVTFQTDIEVLNNEDWESVVNPRESNLPKPMPANINNIYNAQKAVSQLNDKGLTNIEDALIVALRLANMKNINNNKNKLKPIIVFLSDGDPNVGERNPANLVEMVKLRDTSQTAIFTLAFGKDANENMLKDLAENNNGFMRKIYEASDTALQLKKFYNEISSPLLSNINFKFDENELTNVTTTYKHQIFKGSEFVTAGVIKNLIQKNLTVEGITRTGPRTYRIKIKPLKYKSKTKKYGSMERLWAYLTIQKLLKNKKSNSAKKEALDLALKYSFVTPITSLVVVKPNGTEEIDLKKINILKDKTVTNYRPISTTTRSPPVTSNPIRQYNMIHTYSMSTAFDFFRIHDDTTRKTEREFLIPQNDDKLPVWMSPYIRDKNSVNINNTIYFLGDKTTTFDYQSCEIKSENKSAECKLLINCPSVIPKLVSYQAYTNNYLCTLKKGRRINYLGVCCSED